MARLLGLKPHTPDERDIKLTEVYKTSSDLPSDFGATGLDWGMLGNDEFGDCYWASAAHEVMAEATQAGRNPVFSTESVLSSYCGYLGLSDRKKLDEQTDEGTDAREGAKYRTELGVADQNQWANHYQEPGAKGHRIGAYAFIEPGANAYQTILSAIRDFEGVTVCVELPESAEEAFQRAEEGDGEYIWDYVAGSQIVGGHAISGVAVKNGQLVIVSWGQEVVMTEAFVEHYLQTVVVYVSGSILNGEGKSVDGLDLSALRSKLAEVY